MTPSVRSSSARWKTITRFITNCILLMSSPSNVSELNRMTSV